MKIMVINPNSSQHMTRHLDEVLQQIKDADTQLTVCCPEGGPMAIESAYDEAMCLPGLLPLVKKAEAEGCDESVFHRGEVVTECAHSNCSILKNGVLKTHPNDHYILPGIAKNHLIKACKKLNIPVDETPFTLDELRDADEVIVTSSSNFCSFADTFAGRPVGRKAPELIAKIQKEVIQEFCDYMGIQEL